MSRKRKKKPNTSLKIILVAFIIITICYSLNHYYELGLYKKAEYYINRLFSNSYVESQKYKTLYLTQQYSSNAFGIDVSEYQGLIEWNKVKYIAKKTPISFVFIRATAGINKTDSQFDFNWKAAKQQKFITGAYHYYRPDENSIRQAQNFISLVVLQKGDLPPVLDIEEAPKKQSASQLKVGLKKWLNMIENHYKIKPIIYTGEKFYYSYLIDDFREYDIWIANYNNIEKPNYNNWIFWQFTEKGEIKGIANDVDLNVFMGTEKQLHNIVIK